MHLEREFKKKKKNMHAYGQNGKILSCHNCSQKWYFRELFGMQLSFDMCCAVKL